MQNIKEWISSDIDPFWPFFYYFCIGGSLLDIIKHKMRVANCKHGVFDESTIATVLREVLKGLEYFHSNGQIHRYSALFIYFCRN